MAEAGARRPFFRRRKTCPFTGPNAPKIDYKDSKLLMRYVSERGKIVPSRITAVSAKKQRDASPPSPPRSSVNSRAPSSARVSSVCCLTSFAKKLFNPPRSRRGLKIFIRLPGRPVADGWGS